MKKDPGLSIRFFSNIYLIFFFLIISLPSYSYAGGYIDGTLAQDFLNAPAVGPNVVGYMIGDYISPQITHIHLFIRKCECLKRVNYKYEGIFISYNQYFSKAEFNGLTPEVLVGTIDPYGQISRKLAPSQELIAVINRVLEYQKIDNQFVARVSIKFVSMVP
ncbi:MAG: hypothetical protein ACMUIU_15865 [bacterium]